MELDFDFGLSDELMVLRDHVGRFAADNIAPRAEQIHRSNEFPRDLWPALGAMGLLGVTVEPELGGAGLGYLAHALAMEEISRASAAVGLSYAAHSNLCVNQIRLWGTQEQKRRYLPKLVSGEHVGALAMSEPGAGSDVLSMRTRAAPKDDGFVLNGTKMWITNGPEADVLVVYARVDEPTRFDGKRPAQKTDPGPNIKAFIVEKGTCGFSTEPKLDKLGMRGSDTCGLVFVDAPVPKANVLPGNGSAILMSGLDYERVILAAGSLGIMRACIDLVVPYVHSREQFGQPIGTFQLMQAKLADMYTMMNAARAYVYSVAAACDRGSITRFDAAAAILNASERASWVASQSIQALGGNGYSNEYPAGRLWCDAKLYEIGAGTNEIRRWLIGRELFAATKER